MPSVVERVHATALHLATLEIEPPHPPRKETPIYAATHKRLVIAEDRPCWVCGVRRSDLLDPARRRDRTINPRGAKAMETHHWPVERSLLTAIDRVRLAADHPTVLYYKSLVEWVDGEHNMLVLCVTWDTPVLMASGATQAIASIAIGDEVIGSDLRPHRVTQTMCHPVDASLVVVDGVRMTLDHPVLTTEGWKPAGALRPGEIIREVRMFSAQMLGLGGIEPQVFDAIVRSIPVDVMHTLLRSERPSEVLLHHVALLHDRMDKAIFAPVAALPVAPGVDDDAKHLACSDALLPIQPDDAAGVRTVAPQTVRSLARLDSEDFATLRALALSTPAMERLAVRGATGARARAVTVCEACGYPKVGPTYHTLQNGRGEVSLLLAGWRPVNHIRSLTAEEHMFYQQVYNISVAGCHDFVAGGFVVHNCDQCHRVSPVSVHRAPFADVLAEKYAIRLPDGTRFVFAATAQDEAATMATDAQVFAAEGTTYVDPTSIPTPQIPPATLANSVGDSAPNASPDAATTSPVRLAGLTDDINHRIHQPSASDPWCSHSDDPQNVGLQSGPRVRPQRPN